MKVYLQEHLSQVEANHIIDKEDKIELYMLFISCFEVTVFFRFLQEGNVASGTVGSCGRVLYLHEKKCVHYSP